MSEKEAPTSENEETQATATATATPTPATSDKEEVDAPMTTSENEEAHATATPATSDKEEVGPPRSENEEEHANANANPTTDTEEALTNSTTDTEEAAAAAFTTVPETTLDSKSSSSVLLRLDAADETEEQDEVTVTATVTNGDAAASTSVAASEEPKSENETPEIEDVTPPQSEAAAAVAVTAVAPTTLLTNDDAMEEDEPTSPPPSDIEILPEPVTSTEDLEDALPNLQPTPTLNPTLSSPHTSPLLTNIRAYAANTSDRFRNALARALTQPTRDVEAWQALITEAQSLYRRQLPLYRLNRHSVVTSTSASNQLQFEELYLIEAVYGNLLLHFPSSAAHTVQIVRVLFSISALPGEDAGFEDAHTALAFTIDNEPHSSKGRDGHVDASMTERQKVANDKVDWLLRFSLGVELDGKPVSLSDESTKELVEVDGIYPSSSLTPRQKVRSGSLASSMELWRLYIQKRARDAKRSQDSLRDNFEDEVQTTAAEEYVRRQTLLAYETSLDRAGFVSDASTLWTDCLTFVKNWGASNDGEELDSVTKHQRMLTLRSVYQRCVGIPQQGLEETWREYEVFERELSEPLSQALLQEQLPRMQHARQVFLERRQYATSPPAQQQPRLAIPPDNTINEANLISKWKTRVAYERANPERLQPTALGARVRYVYKEAVGLFARHPEVWVEWSSWESGGFCGGGVDAADEVLKCAIEKLPHCALLVACQSELLESSGKQREAINVLENFLKRFPCSLGYILLQRVVRRCGTQGNEKNSSDSKLQKEDNISAARRVFARARRTLRPPPADAIVSAVDGTGGSSAKVGDKSDSSAGVIGVAGGLGVVSQSHQTSVSSASGAVTEIGTDRSLVSSGVGANVSGLANGGASGGGKMTKRRKARRRKPSTTFGLATTATTTIISGKHNAVSPDDGGVMTHHVYASHAHMELRNNGLPDVAARVFELGLSKHRSFITCPLYVLAYAKLLLERGDEDNLRSLLERSLSACEEVGTNKDSMRPLWDLLLEFECNHSRSAGDPSAIKILEARRCRALNSNNTDEMNSSNELGIPKVLQDQLSRVDGENAGLISGGLGRLMERYELIGILGEGADHDSMGSGDDGTNTGLGQGGILHGGGAADLSFAKRFHSSNMTSMSNVISGMGTLDRSKAARERMQAANQTQIGNNGQNNNPASRNNIDFLSNYPEWLRNLISLLPQNTSRYGRGGISNSKPPPHMIELALTSLRSHPLPPKPVSTGPPMSGLSKLNNQNTNSLTPGGNGMGANGRGKKRRMDEDGDSSDDDGNNTGSGYGNQFKLRQRARVASTM